MRRRRRAADPVDVARDLSERAIVNLVEECAVVAGRVGDKLNSLVERGVLASDMRIDGRLRCLLVDRLLLAIALRNARAVTTAVEGN